jgi:cytochrome P450
MHGQLEEIQIVGMNLRDSIQRDSSMFRLILRVATSNFIPFGAGKRMCPGMLFAIANIEFPLAHMLYHFDWKPADGLKPEDLDMTESLGGTVKRKRDLKLIPISYRSLVG